ncbi:hypothetical protein EVAR_35251_1 [Eumeta japonica]|uniref:Uncharacterized protein n=1 Tax=Eumeta variegata TaxID=151549 RepID=A0A4C1VG32_EUMVA|nr:hypothetical protein EVAR_35251_1 [Eumeta japonica]
MAVVRGPRPQIARPHPPAVTRHRAAHLPQPFLDPPSAPPRAAIPLSIALLENVTARGRHACAGKLQAAPRAVLERSAEGARLVRATERAFPFLRTIIFEIFYKIAIF